MKIDAEEKFKELWRLTGLTADEFAMRLGEKAQRVKDVLRGKTKLPMDMFLRMEDALPLNMEWFMGSEEHQPFYEPISPPTDKARASRSSIASQELAKYDVGDDFVSVPRFDVRLSMGAGAEVTAEDQSGALMFRRAFLGRLGVEPHNAKLMDSEGDSMLPEVRSGDIVLIDVGDSEMWADAIYAIRLDGKLMLKRLQRVPGGVKIISENAEKYHPIQVELGDEASQRDFVVIGRMRWFGRET